MLGKSNFIKKCNNMKIDGKRSQSQIKNGDILLSYIGLLCQGKTSYDAIHEMSDDPEYFKLALGITRAIPSAETLRQRMDVERLPSGKFDTNELVLELTVIAYNILRLIGQESLKSKRSPKFKGAVSKSNINQRMKSCKKMT